MSKGDKVLDNSSFFRLIYLLSTVSKLFERLIKSHTENELDDNDNHKDHQYGFRKGRSTVDAIKRLMNIVNAAGSRPHYRRKLFTVVALVVANAFNSEKWLIIIEALCVKGFPLYLVGMMKSYL